MGRCRTGFRVSRSTEASFADCGKLGANALDTAADPGLENDFQQLCGKVSELHAAPSSRFRVRNTVFFVPIPPLRFGTGEAILNATVRSEVR